MLRVLDRHSGLLPLDQLGLKPAQEAVLRRLADRPDGIVLATGPTGSGKTTTLYSLLQLADHGRRNIVTVEDPIEYHLPGISQTQTNAEIGMTFAAGLRATLRQDPDVILVGEIRDTETAQVAAQAPRPRKDGAARGLHAEHRGIPSRARLFRFRRRSRRARLSRVSGTIGRVRFRSGKRTDLGRPRRDP